MFRSRRARAATAVVTPCCSSDVFRGPGEDWLERPSNWLDGVRSIAVGMAGNESLRTGLPVKIADLGLGVELTRLVLSLSKVRRRTSAGSAHG